MMALQRCLHIQEILLSRLPYQIKTYELLIDTNPTSQPWLHQLYVRGWSTEKGVLYAEAE